MSLRAYIITIVLASLVACAEVPRANYDALRDADPPDQAGHLAYLREQGEEIAGTKFIAGNKVTLLRDGAATYPAMLEAIHSARHRVDMESFLFDKDEGGRFAKALLERREAGVEVNLIYDAIGSGDTPPELFDRMRKAGINVLEYNPVNAQSVLDTSFNRRDHRKLLMVDGKIAFTGGVNISGSYNIKARIKRFFHVDEVDRDDIPWQKLPWRDTQVKIEGPVVAEFERLFMETWRDKNGVTLPPPPSTPQAPRGDLMVQTIDGTPDLGRYTIYRSLLMAISLAHSTVHLTTAFFVPTPDLLDALESAVKRGVEVVLILPSETDSALALAGGHAYYEELLEAGVQIYERQGAVLHAKTAVIDGIWSTVGSSNLDWRSVLFNNECNAVILGAQFGKQMEDMFQDDLKQSRYIDRESWGHRPFSDTLDEWKAQMIEFLL